MDKWGLNKQETVEPNGRPSNDILLEKPSYLEHVNNRIYFYSDIKTESILKLNQTLTDMEHSHISSKIIRGRKEPDPIFLHINSYGGSIFAGLAGLDTLVRTKKTVPITTIVDGCCASAGTFLSVAGTHRLINKNSFMLIHQLSSIMWGKYENFKDEMKNLDRLMETIRGVYAEYTEIPMEKLEEILKHDLWFDAETCLRYGLVDKII